VGAGKSKVLNFGLQLAKQGRRKGLTQAELAKKTGTRTTQNWGVPTISKRARVRCR
jgi:transcriptional regulator with XRE-family HTH domain